MGDDGGIHKALMARTTACVNGAFFGGSEPLDVMLAMLLANSPGAVRVVL